MMMEKTITDKFSHTPATPEGFSITTDVVSEEAWEEIKLYLGLRLRTNNSRVVDNDNDDDDNDNDGILMSPDAYNRHRWDHDLHIIDLHTETDIDIDKKEECIDKNGHPLSRIIWELTPSPQNRPVAQFGFRYDYKRGIVVVPVEGNSAVPFKEEEEEEDDKKIDNGVTTTSDGHNDSANAKVITTTVPKIPELFKLLLLRPYYNQQTSRIDIRNDKYNDTDVMNDEHEHEYEYEYEYEYEIENENEMEHFTQCIVNVYHPTTMMHKTMNDSCSNYDSCGGDNEDEDDTTDPASSRIRIRTRSRRRSTTTSPTTHHSRRGSHIPWHVDDPRFGPVILVFTFGETRPLNMRLLKHTTPPPPTTTNRNSYDGEVVVDDDDNDSDHSSVDRRSSKNQYSYFTAHPLHRSCYQLSGLARTKWEHSIPTGTGWRVSITFRTVVEEKITVKKTT